MRPSSWLAAFCVLGILAVPLAASMDAPVFRNDYVDDWFRLRGHEAARDRGEALGFIYETCTVTLENGSEREFENGTRCIQFASDRGLINESSPWYWPTDDGRFAEKTGPYQYDPNATTCLHGDSWGDGTSSSTYSEDGWSVERSGHVGRPVAFPITVTFDDTRPNRPDQEYTVAEGEGFHPGLSDGVRYIITVEGANGEQVTMGGYEHRGRGDVTLVVCCGGSA